MNSSRLGTIIGLALGLGLCLFIFWPLFTSIREAEEYARIESTAYAQQIATAEAQATLVPLNVDFGFERFLEVVEVGSVYVVGKDTLPEGVSAEATSGVTEFVEGPVPYEALEVDAFGSHVSAYHWFDQCNVDIPGIQYIGGDDEDGGCSVVVSGPGWLIGFHFDGNIWEIAVPDK